jgi:hypothetical protein
MATFILHHETRYSPAEYTSEAPVHCVDCGAEWDADEDACENYEHLDGKAYCTTRVDSRSPSCMEKAKSVAFRVHSAEIIDDKLSQLWEELEDLERDYPIESNEPGDPFAMVEDIKKRAKLFAVGKDTGFRDAIMLDHLELYRVRSAISSAVAVSPEHPNLAPSTLEALRGVLALLETAEKRTSEAA